MLFKDRIDAGYKLADKLTKDIEVTGNKKGFIILSLLRGGSVVGDVVAEKLNILHIPFVVKKISAPEQEELAIGALCFNTVYLDNKIIAELGLNKKDVNNQINLTKKKFLEYCIKFGIKETDLTKVLTGKSVIIIDDGIATGATVKAVFKYLKEHSITKIILAVPGASIDFQNIFYKEIILCRDPFVSAVSQYYENFSQLEDSEVKKILYNASQRNILVQKSQKEQHEV